MKLIVGLGNPGREYESTRHNIGFMMIDKYTLFKNIANKWNYKFNGLYLETNLFGEKVIFLKPQSYMNLSGTVVKRFIDYYKIDVADILVISDDLDLNIGNFKIKDKGSSGGHNGLKDIENSIGTSEYKRLKIGINNDKNIDTKDYVLGKISKEYLKRYDDLFNFLCTVLDDYFNISFVELMNKYNKKNR